MSFNHKGEIQTSPNKQNFRESIATTPALQEILKGALWTEMKGQ